jgi:hypothetical protein
MDNDSLSLEQHCQTIRESRRILGKIVILCEGHIQDFEGRRSPQSYRQMEKVPDANFYTACVPKDWTQNRPVFFTCGGRGNVLQTYFKLLDLHNLNPNNSYLDPARLFAIVDCDFSPQPVQDYPFSDLDEIFHALYDQLELNPNNIPSHRIFVTGLVHKENYFLIPELQTVFDKLPCPPQYRNSAKPLDLYGLYKQMAQDLHQDADLSTHWLRAHQRVKACTSCDPSNPEKFSQDWQTAFSKTIDPIERSTLAQILLTLRKAKEYWEDYVSPPIDWSQSEQTYKDQTTLAIGRFYSENSHNPRFHIPFLLKQLQQHQDLVLP